MLKCVAEVITATRPLGAPRCNVQPSYVDDSALTCIIGLTGFIAVPDDNTVLILHTRLAAIHTNPTQECGKSVYKVTNMLLSAAV